MDIDKLQFLADLLPAVMGPIEKIADDHGDEIEGLAKRVFDSAARVTVSQFQTYMDEGMTREEALILVVSGKEALHDRLRAAGNNS